MPSNTRWLDDEKTIILHEVVGHWRIPDVLAEINESEIRLDLKIHQPKYFIFDLQKSVGIPHGILEYRSNYNGIISNNTYTFIVGAHPIITTFVNAMQRMGLAGTTVFADNREEAYDLIQLQKQAMQQM